jgi:predicted ATPase/class 3 adenylate cyclase
MTSTQPSSATNVAGRGSPGLPTGTVTFLLTDIEGSTRLLLDLGERYSAVLERHNEILRAAVAAQGGTVVSTAGDSVFAAFPTARGAVLAAVTGQRGMAAEPWPDGRAVRVRMGVHTGEGTLGGDDYIGLDVHRAARISAAAHGGQVVLSAATAGLLTGETALRDLGEHRLKDLVTPEHLFQLLGPGLASQFPALRSAGGRLTLLPVPRTSFVARPEVEAVTALVADHQLVTLTGPGGTGKTRLAVEAARRLADAFADGVVFVDLSPVLHPDLVATAVIGTLGLEAGSTPAPDRLREHLVGRSMLLVLDNFEQVMEAAPLVADLVSACRSLHVLVTSRSPLLLSAEQQFPVPTLDLPAGTDPEALLSSPAVQLFADRARRVLPSFQVTSENAADIAAITRRLDGLPLAIELAAARVRLLPPSAIAARLASSGSAELSARDRDVPRRQRTLDAVIEWSYDLLPPDAQQAFRRMSVFVGGARLEEVEPVVAAGGDADILDLLSALHEQSLLRQSEVDGDVRFRMLVTIAEYAGARLAASGEDGETRERHADAFLALAEQAAPSLTGWDQTRWLDRLERDHDNLRVAYDRCVAAGDSDRSLRFAAALWRFWQIRGHLDEGARRVDAALRLGTGNAQLRARALEAAGGIAWWRGQIGYACEVYRQALDLTVAFGDLAATANARYNLALATGFEGGVGEARPQMMQARDEARRAGDRRGEAWAVWGLANLAVRQADWAGTARHGDEALSMFRALDDPFGIGWALFTSSAGLSRMADGDRELARRRFQEGTRLFAGFRDLTAITLHAWSLAQLEVLSGRPDRALRLVGASRALKQRTGAGLLDVNEEMLAVFDGSSTTTLASAGLSHSDAERLVAEGLRFSPDEVVAYILDELPDPRSPLADSA